MHRADLSRTPSDPDRLAALERRVRRLQGTVTVLGAGLAAAVLLSSGAARGGRSDEVLRARGLVVEDAEGRPRIVLGAPLDRLEGRKRSDPTVGILLIDEDGDDRVSLGSPAIAPQMKGQVHQRIAASSGLVVNDGEGNERTGYGYLENGGVVLGLDHEGGEGVMLFISPDSGYQGFLVNGPSGEGDRQRVFLGTSLGKTEASGGVLVLNNEDASRHTMISGRGRSQLPSIVVHAEGEPVADLAEGRGEAK